MNQKFRLSKKKVITTSPEETKKLLSAVFKTSEMLLEEKTRLFILPAVPQIILPQSRYGHVDTRDSEETKVQEFILEITDQFSRR